MLVALVACNPVQNPHARHAAPPTLDAEELIATRVERWDLLDAFRAPSELEQGIAVRLAGASGWPLASEAEACVAREVATFFGRYRAIPDEILTRWISASCGEPDVPALVDWLEFDERDPHPVTAAIGRWAPFLASGGEGTHFGVGSHTRGGRRVLVVTASKPVVDVFRSGPDADGVVRVQGRVRFETDRVGAAIGHGLTGGSGCSCEEDDELPEFDCSCQMAQGDEEAWIELLSSEGASSGPFATVLARRPGAPGTYHRPNVRLPRRDDDATALVDGINVLRRKAGLDPLRREAEQTRLAQSLYSAMFKTDGKVDGPTQARFLEELHVGRAVAAPIRGSGVQQHIARAGNAADWLAFELMLPTSRGFLLDSRAESIALVTHHEPALGFGGAFAAYSFFRESDDAAAAQNAYAGMERIRFARGLATKRVSSGELTPAEALSSALAAINAQSKRLFSGSWFKLRSTIALQDLPEALRAARDLECGVVGAHRKGPTSLGEYVVLVVYPIVGKAS